MRQALTMRPKVGEMIKAHESEALSGSMMYRNRIEMMDEISMKLTSFWWNQKVSEHAGWPPGGPTAVLQHDRMATISRSQLQLPKPGGFRSIHSHAAPPFSCCCPSVL